MKNTSRGGHDTLRPGSAYAGHYGTAEAHKDEAKLTLKWRLDAVESNQKVSREKATSAERLSITTAEEMRSVIARTQAAEQLACAVEAKVLREIGMLHDSQGQAERDQHNLEQQQSQLQAQVTAVKEQATIAQRFGEEGAQGVRALREELAREREAARETSLKVAELESAVQTLRTGADQARNTAEAETKRIDMLDTRQEQTAKKLDESLADLRTHLASATRELEARVNTQLQDLRGIATVARAASSPEKMLESAERALQVRGAAQLDALRGALREESDRHDENVRSHIAETTRQVSRLREETSGLATNAAKLEASVAEELDLARAATAAAAEAAASAADLRRLDARVFSAVRLLGRERVLREEQHTCAGLQRVFDGWIGHVRGRRRLQDFAAQVKQQVHDASAHARELRDSLETRMAEAVAGEAMAR
jgi:hypothetical protein